MFFGAEWFDLERISHLPLHGSNFDFGKIGGMDSVLESQHGFGASTHGLLDFLERRVLPIFGKTCCLSF